MFVLGFVNALFFYPHYLGRATFPWDFIGGYHAMPYAWLRDGGFFNPPLWSPYGNFGFPAHLGLQNSSFYLPILPFDVFNIDYTLTAAAVLQCLTVFVGSLGLFTFLRLNKISVLTALLAGVLFQLSATFFSNAQHVDIVRGAALLPWLLVVFSRDFLVSNRRIVVSAWVLFIFLTGSYPGLIVATIYGMLVYATFELSRSESPVKIPVYSGRVAGVLLIALLLSLIKFLPFLLLRDELLELGKDKNSIHPVHWLTVFFRFDLDIFPSVLTLRSYFIPPIAILLIGFTQKIARVWLLGLSLITVSVILASAHSPLGSLVMKLPGMDLSRMHIVDFRVIIHLGFIMMAFVSKTMSSWDPMSHLPTTRIPAANSFRKRCCPPS